MIRYYLDAEPIIENVPTYLCARDKDRQFVLDHLEELVVKSVAEAGGYGMLIGPQASRTELADFDSKIRANPRNFIAQPTLQLPPCPPSATGSSIPAMWIYGPTCCEGNKTGSAQGD